MVLSTYLPQDRLRAIANNLPLPEHADGSVLFADLSGFTTLAESLIKLHGKRRGTEKLSSRLERVYTALIAKVEAVGGSVVGFAGDAIACWWGGNDSALKAAVAALGMQAAMQDFPELDLKAGVASGPVRRFVVGDPEIQQLDLLTGETVTRASVAERLAKAGQVWMDEATLKALGQGVQVSKIQDDPESGEKFGGISGLEIQIQAEAGKATPKVDDALLHGWLHPAVVVNTRELLQTDLRPCTALFVRFTGIDFESDEAGKQLRTFVATAQRSAERHDGILLDIVIGDKGSYAYVNFGALSAHEDDSRRAVKTALELRNKTELQLQMGITQGLMRVGAYGGETRKVFGALGDDVNLAARLMTTARENEILLSSHVYKATRNEFTFEPRPPLPMKGKSEPLPVFSVTGESQRRAVRLQEPNYSLPMVGRQAELKLIEEKLELAMGGKSQVIGIVAEAGVGKSRLVAEVIRSARKMGFVGFGGACQSDGVHTPYLAWKSIWGAFFDVDPEMPDRRLVRLLEGEIEDRAPSRLEAMPLLNVVLNLDLPENDFTQNLEPEIRQSALHALLEDCLKAQADDEPTLIVIEDLHWIDALSHDLLEGLARALANYAVCFLLAYRPPQLERLQSPRIEALEQFTRIELHELTTAEAESAVRAKLAQLYPARGGALPDGLVEALMARAQGNPFYLEELLNYVRDRGLDPADIQNIELPDSLHTLILSRIDQLSEGEKTTLRAASIVGRLFRARWLTGYYPELGSFPQVKASLDELDKLEITPLDSEPELIYLFKHILTHEVTYESLPFAMRARLHEQLARYLESADAPVETIAFHYGRSENREKQIEYLRRAGDVSQKNFANDAALEYYGMLLPLLKDDREKHQIYLKRGEVLLVIGDFDAAESDYRAALESAGDDMALKAGAQYALGRSKSLRGENRSALEWLGQAKEAYTRLEDTIGLAQVFIGTGKVFQHKGEIEQARESFNQGLALAREADDKLNTAQALNNLGSVASELGDFPAARALYEESLALRRELGDKGGVGQSLNYLGSIAFVQGNYAAARGLFEESLALSREIGAKQGAAWSLNNLGDGAQAQGDYTAAQALHEQSLALRREMGDKRGIAMSCNNLGNAASAQGDYTAAQAWYEKCLALCREMGDKNGIAFELLSLGLVGLAEDRPDAREKILDSLRLRVEMGQQYQQTSSLIGVAGLVLQEGNPHFAAQLLGAVKSALNALNAVVEVDVKFFHEATLERIKEALGEVAFQSAWEEGSQWSLDEAVKKVLGE